MKCDSCEKSAIFSGPQYCKEHFCEYLEDKVLSTIKNFGLLKKKDKIVVGASGGKDSLTILYMLNKFCYNVTALAIDEGIKNYRDLSLFTLKEFCEKNKIKLRVVSFKDKFNKSLDEILFKKNERPCTVCGVFRRYLLNLHARDYDALVTGHNMDDEAQAIVMNLVKNNISALQRAGPKTGITTSKKFTSRVKPLYFCSEKEVMSYAFINNLTTNFNECPNVSMSFRLRIRNTLNEIEGSMPGTKKNIIEWSLNNKGIVVAPKTNLEECCVCGELSSTSVCMACKYSKKIKV
ncbi:MAG: TIGR00269 family protein [Nanoarchaeota archaeon]